MNSKEIRILKHGHRAKSIVKYELEEIADALNHPWKQPDFNIFEFLSCSFKKMYNFIPALHAREPFSINPFALGQQPAGRGRHIKGVYPNAVFFHWKLRKLGNARASNGGISRIKLPTSFLLT